MTLITVSSLFLAIIPLVASQCDSTHYHAQTTGIEETSPLPLEACVGLPFFPECEPDNRKYFRVKSGTDVAIFLAGTAQIFSPYTEDYYQLVLEVDDDVTITRGDGTALTVIPASAPANNLLQATDFVDLWVSVIPADGTIHLGRTNGGEIASWKDDDLHDVNYILVQNFNDDSAQTAEWEFCDRAVKLLSQNYEGTLDEDVIPSHRTPQDDDANRDVATAEKAIDGDIPPNGAFDELECQTLANEVDTNGGTVADDAEVTAGLEPYAWWRIDLGDMYHVKAVSIVGSAIDSQLCPKGWRHFRDSCFYEGTTLMDWADAEADCDNKGGHLATVDSPELNIFLKAWLLPAPNKVPDNGGYWIGLEDITTTDEYEWVDGTAGFFNDVGGGTVGEEFGTIIPAEAYHNFRTSLQPSSTTQDCVEMREVSPYELQWNDWPCGTLNKYVCQIRLPTPLGTTLALCGPGGADYSWTLEGNYCYWQSTTNKDWYDAAADCVVKGGHLASVNTAEKQTFMEGFLTDYDGADDGSYWIGLNDQATDNEFKWHGGEPAFNWMGGRLTGDGEHIPESAYENFKAVGNGQPSGRANELCVEMRDDDGGFDNLEWNDEPCAKEQRYVCQKVIDYDALVQNIVNSEVRVGSCDHNDATGAANEWAIMGNNDMCGVPITRVEAGLDHVPFWTFRECDTNYYGQYVYIRKEDFNNVAWFSLCEVEVWGIPLTDDNKPKVGFTENVVSGLENDLDTQTFTVIKTDGSPQHPTCLSFDVVLVGGDTTAIEGAGNDYTQDTALGTFTFDHTYDPNNPTTYSFDLTVLDDYCEVEDDTVVYGFDNLSPGLCAGDDDHITYDTITYNILNDDVTYRWEYLTYEVLERGVTVTAKLIREGYTGGTTTASVVSMEVGSQADEDEDYLRYESDIVFGPNDTEKDVIVTILEDDQCELPADGPETFELVVSADDACQIAVDTTTVSIIPDDVTFRFLGTPEVEYTVSEIRQRTVEVVVERVGYIDDVAFVGVKSQPFVPDVSAMPEDYTAIDTTLTFDVGKTTASLTVTADDDNLVEDFEEIFNLVLVKNPTTLPDCVLVTDDVAEITIEDDDCNWSMMTEEISVLEDSDYATITVMCTRPDDMVLNRQRSAVLQISSSGITDGTAATPGVDFTQSGTSTVVIAAGETSTTIQVPILDDINEEPVEFFEVTLLSSDDGELDEAITTRVTINDDDVTVRLTTCDQDGMLILENAGELTVTVERTGDLAATDSVLLFTNPQTASTGSAIGEGDFVGVNTELRFDTMKPTVSQDIIINDDTIYEGDEYFVVQLRKQNQDTFVDETIARCVVTIKDDDCGFRLSISDEDRLVPEDIEEVSVTITRSGFIDYSSSVYVQTTTLNNPLTETDANPGVDYAAIAEPKLVTFEPGQTSQTIKIAIIDDAYPEVDENFMVVLTGADCSVFGGNSVVIGIDDNDEVEISMKDVSITVNEDDGVAYITVLRTGSLARVDTVTFTIVPRAYDGTSSAATINSDFINDPITVTFDQSEEQKTIEVPLIDDDIEEVGLESFLVRIKNVKQDPDGGITVTDATIDNDNRETVVYIRDDDGMFSLRSLGRYSESVGSITITMDRTGPTSQEQTVYISTRSVDASSPGDYESLLSVPLTFSPGATSASLSLNIYDDKRPEGSEDFLVCWSEDPDDDNTVQCVEIVTIEDDDNQIRFVNNAGTTNLPNEVTVQESIGTVRLQVQRSRYGSSAPAGTATVNILAREVSNSLTTGVLVSPADGDGVDYSLSTTTVTFRQGQTRADVLLEIVDDELGERQEVFEVVLVDVSPDGNNFIVYPDTWKVYINDDDGGAPDDEGPVDGDGGSGGGLSRSFIVGIGGGLGLLVLVGILGLLGCFLASRLYRRNARAQPLVRNATPRAPVLVAPLGPPSGPRALRAPPLGPPTIRGQPLGPPPNYYGQQPVGYRNNLGYR